MASKDVRRFNRLKKALQDLTTEKIKIGSIKNVKLDLTIKGVKFNLHNPELGDEYFTESPFGYKGKTVVDKTVRRSKEIALTNETVEDLVSLSLLGQKICMTVTEEKLLCVPYKLLKYGVGDFFNTHTDTRTSEFLVKTLVLHLPSKGVKGGELTFNGTYKPNDAFDKKKSGIITYTLFDIKIAHSVTPVTKGERYAITFKVHDCQKFKFGIDQTTMCIGSANFDEIANDKNILIVYSDLDRIEAALEHRNVPHIRVYFPHSDESKGDVRVVYDEINEDPEEADECYEEYTFDNIKEGQQYIVTKKIDVGKPEEGEVSYTMGYEYTGNEGGDEEEHQVKYHVGLLLNPEPRSDSGSEPESKSDSESESKSDSEPESKRPCKK